VLDGCSISEADVLIGVVMELEHFLSEQVQVQVNPSDGQLILALIVDRLSHVAATSQPETLNLVNKSSDILDLTLQLDFLFVHLPL
jgi:hypothetical protein